MRLRGEVIDLVRSKFGYELMHARGIGHVTVMEMQILSRQMFIVVQVIDATAVERAGPPDESVDFIALVQKLLGHVRAVLAGHSSNERSSGFRHVIPPRE